MIDTNSIAQAVQVAQAVNAQVQTNWPAICAVGALASRELCKANGWLEYVAAKVIAHGGLLRIARNFFWNPTK